MAEETIGVDAPSPSEAFNAEITTSTSPSNDDVAKRIQEARAQEKSKLYPQLEKLQEELSILRKRDEERAKTESEREAERAAKRAEREAQKKAQLEDEMNVKELLKTKESEWQKQLDAERQERQKAFDLLQREREYQELQNYRSQRMEQERTDIMPELLDLVDGNSKDEIEQSILRAKEKTAKILESVQAASQQSRKEMVGTRVTVPASGPLDTNSDSNIVQDVANMSMADYIKNRDRLLRSGSNNRGQGLFGN